MFGGPIVLHESAAIGRLHLGEAQRPVSAAAGQNYGDASPSAVLRQRSKEDIDRHEQPVGRRPGL
jgi:hypothetical protein